MPPKKKKTTESRKRRNSRKRATTGKAPAAVKVEETKRDHLRVEHSVAVEIGERSYQEDRHVIVQLERPEIWLFAVFDGHGGSRCSEFCKNNVARILNEGLRSRPAQNIRLDSLLRTAMAILCTSWDDEVFGKGVAQQLYKGQKERDAFYKKMDYNRHQEEEGDSGTTAVVALLDTRRRKVVIANCGDSRAVVRPAGRTNLISTNDHVVPLRLNVNNFKVKIEDGRVEADLAMARSIGDHSSTLSGVISREADITTVDVKEGGRMIIASDGLWDIYSNPEVFVNNETANELLKRRKHKIDDNVTAIVVVMS